MSKDKEADLSTTDINKIIGTMQDAIYKSEAMKVMKEIGIPLSDANKIIGAVVSGVKTSAKDKIKGVK